LVSQSYFDTVLFAVNEKEVAQRCDEKKINVRFWNSGQVSVSIGENTSLEDIKNLVYVLSGKDAALVEGASSLAYFSRNTSFMSHPVFNQYHSETEMLRYMKKLENKDLSLAHAMIALGSCTMKLNATSEMIPVTMPAFANMHPYAPVEQTKGYQAMINGLHDDLCECTGFAGVSLQPNSGAQGELSGLLVIMAYHNSRGDHQRNICLIPSSAHGIGVAQHLVPFLPGNPLVKTGGDQAIESVSGAPFGSALILLISYGYIKMLGATGVTDSTKVAILNANYMKALLENHYPVLYTGSNGRVAHEMILDCRAFKAAGIEVEDIAKRLMDYGFHAPTVSFPVAGTVMIEPTESEPFSELNRFCEALIAIRQEIAEVENGTADKTDNVLKMAPHTAVEVCADEWTHANSRSKAAYPIDGLKDNKFWSSVGRVDNAYGDRNLVCTCPPMEAYNI